MQISESMMSLIPNPITVLVFIQVWWNFHYSLYLILLNLFKSTWKGPGIPLQLKLLFARQVWLLARPPARQISTFGTNTVAMHNELNPIGPVA